MNRRPTPLKLVSSTRSSKVNSEKHGSKRSVNLSSKTPTKKPRPAAALFFSMSEYQRGSGGDNRKSAGKQRVFVGLGSGALEHDPILPVDESDYVVQNCLYIRNINMELYRLNSEKTRAKNKPKSKKKTKINTSTIAITNGKDKTKIKSSILQTADLLTCSDEKIETVCNAVDLSAEFGSVTDLNAESGCTGDKTQYNHKKKPSTEQWLNDGRATSGNWGAKSLRLPKSRLTEEISVIQQDFENEDSDNNGDGDGDGDSKDDSNMGGVVSNATCRATSTGMKRGFSSVVQQEIAREKRVLVKKLGYALLDSFPEQCILSPKKNRTPTKSAKCIRNSVCASNNIETSNGGSGINTELKSGTSVTKYKPPRRLFTLNYETNCARTPVAGAAVASSFGLKSNKLSVKTSEKAKLMEFGSFSNNFLPDQEHQNKNKKNNQHQHQYQQNQDQIQNSPCFGRSIKAGCFNNSKNKISGQEHKLMNKLLIESSRENEQKPCAGSSFKSIDSICF